MRVKRAGEVIPQVLGPVLDLRADDAKPFRFPPRCPVCAEPLERRAGEAATYCVNIACPAQLVRQLEHFASRGAMDITGLGEQVAALLVDKDFVHDIGDVYALPLYWRSGLGGLTDYRVFVHLVGADGRPRAQADGPPADGAYPTPIWRAGETVADLRRLTIPPDLPPGEYAIIAGPSPIDGQPPQHPEQSGH